MQFIYYGNRKGDSTKSFQIITTFQWNLNLDIHSPLSSKFKILLFLGFHIEWEK